MSPAKVCKALPAPGMKTLGNSVVGGLVSGGAKLNGHAKFFHLFFAMRSIPKLSGSKTFYGRVHFLIFHEDPPKL